MFNINIGITVSFIANQSQNIQTSILKNSDFANGPRAQVWKVNTQIMKIDMNVLPQVKTQWVTVSIASMSTVVKY